jgi:hypothetical protein
MLIHKKPVPVLESVAERRNQMAENELTINARLRELEAKVAELAELKGQMLQVNQYIASSNRLTIWQFISFTLVMAGTLFGTLTWISGSLREEMRQSRDQLQRQMEQTERNMNARFEDLRQVVLAQQKQAPPKQ